MQQPPLIAHVIHHLQIGGLENGLVNLINNLPSDAFRHAVVCIDGATSFRLRLNRQDVPVYAMHKPPGHSPLTQWRLGQLFKRLRPDILHTRNLSALDALLPGVMCRVPVRIHGEHGRDVNDLKGANRKLQLLRRVHSPLVHRYVTVSKDLERYLIDKVGIAPQRIQQIYNGVNTARFNPDGPVAELDPSFDGITIGTVGRLQPVKDQMTLLKAFAQLRSNNDLGEAKLRLLIVGDGPSRPSLEAYSAQAGLAESVVFVGARDDVPELYRSMDVFVLPSIAEGISNTVLEALACGLPVIATAVGGNPELVESGTNGQIVPPSDPGALADAISSYRVDRRLRDSHGHSARQRAVEHFSIDNMVESYGSLYAQALANIEAA